jgi:hypothetical protein
MHSRYREDCAWSAVTSKRVAFTRPAEGFSHRPVRLVNLAFPNRLASFLLHLFSSSVSWLCENVGAESISAVYDRSAFNVATSCA